MAKTSLMIALLCTVFSGLICMQVHAEKDPDVIQMENVVVTETRQKPAEDIFDGVSPAQIQAPRISGSILDTLADKP
ncbi:MAG: hypothetical protein KJP07_00615, partial [Desulfatitalea sp.]|nr:hypothetical protein [Desulfatitalea sp.]